MHTDPLADLLTRIRNAIQAKHTSVHAPYSKIKEAVLHVLKEKELIENFETVEAGKFKELKIELKADKKLHLKRVSTPGKRIYMKSTDLRKPRNGLGLNIISTSKGVMAGEEAKKQKLGGELICEAYQLKTI